MAFRPRDNKTPTGAKRRWSADDRARRTSAAEPGARRASGNGRRTEVSPTSRAGRRDAAFGADRNRGEAEQGGRQDRRTDWYPGPRTNPRRDEQRGGARRSTGADRPYRGDRPARDDRPDRGYRNARPARDDRTARDDRPSRSYGDDRPSRSYGDDRPSRPFRDERPSRDDRRDRAARDERPAREGRPFREQRPDRAPREDRAPRAGRPWEDRSDTRGRSSRDGAPGRATHDGTERWTPPEDVVLDRLEGEIVTADEVAGISFADLGLGDGITRALGELGATTPFPIQAATIPDALAGRNVLGRGRTGSGKTIAFGAALVERLMRNWHESGRAGSGRRMGRAPRALILAPTRELALQIDRTVQPIARSVGLFTTQIVGGVPQGRQVGALGKGVDIVIGTPGRMEDLIEQ
ncbi:MAG: hypothetical protein QOE37_796, partial [Microbacteriaceae bacterium]|nr:hypothetical protein [Microbacteriaceae bacterium]